MKQPFDTDSDGRRRTSPLRTIMAWTGWVLLLAVLVIADPFGIHPLDSWLGSSDDAVGKGPEVSAEARLWTCGMHPNVIQEEPGVCPICHMDLVPLETEETGHEGDQETAELWACPMHPQVLEENPGACPICHMDLVAVETETSTGSSGHAGHDEAHLWTCPMHPEVLRDEPGACPICGMDLVPVTDGKAQASAAVQPSRAGGAPRRQGTAVTIDPVVVQNMNVETEAVERRDISRRVRTVGYLEYDQETMVSVTTKYNGFVEKSHVNYLGQPVHRGEPVLEIYSPELVQTEQELLAAATYVRQMEKASPEARARAQALLDAARTRLSYWDITPEQIETLESSGTVFRTLTLVAPASGVVMKRMEGLEGMSVRPGMELLHIAGLSTLWLKVEVFEDQLPWVDAGSRASISFTYFPGERFEGRVRYVSPDLSEKTRTLGLTLEVPNRDQRLRPGMYATVLFEPVAARAALAVPAQAVLRTGQRDLVVVALGNGRFAPREVRLGAQGDGFVQVLGGIGEGERIVTSAQFLIDSESNLRAAIQKMIAARSTGGSRPDGGSHVH